MDNEIKLLIEHDYIILYIVAYLLKTNLSDLHNVSRNQ